MQRIEAGKSIIQAFSEGANALKYIEGLYDQIDNLLAAVDQAQARKKDEEGQLAMITARLRVVEGEYNEMEKN